MPYLKDFLDFVRLMYDDNYAERWEAGMKPFSNEWEYLVQHRAWLEKEFYHRAARKWQYEHDFSHRNTRNG